MLKFIFVLSSVFFLAENFGYSQDQQIDIRKKVNAYLEHYAIKDIHIDFNQPVYSPGDSAFFVVSSSQLRSVPKSYEIFTICVLDGKGQNLLKQKIVLQGGVAVNQLVFPLDIKPGLYQWIILVDRFKTDKPSLLRGTVCIVDKKKILTESALAVEIEGNSFINELECRLKLRLRNEFESKAIVVSNNLGDVVGRGTTDSTGAAKIVFIPNESFQFYTVSIEDVPASAVQLPPRLNKGCTLHEVLDSEGSGSLKISSNNPGHKNLVLVWCSSSQVLSVNKIILNEENEVLVKIPAHFENISHALLVDASLNVLAQHRILNLKSHDKKVDVRLIRNEFFTRDSVQVKLRANDEIDWLVMRVLNKSLFTESRDQVSSKEHLETDEEPFFSNRLEFRGDLKVGSYQEIRGKVNMENKIKSTDSIQIMLFLQKSMFGYETYVDKDSHFKVPLVFKTEDKEPVFYSIRTKRGDVLNPTIEFEADDFNFLFSIQQFKESDEPDRYGEYAFAKRIIQESYTKRFAALNEERYSNAKFEEELGGADIIRKLDDYNPFNSIDDVIREIIPAVEYRKKGERDVVKVFTTEKRPNDIFGPLYIIDGVFFKNPSVFLNLPIEDVETIKVVKDSRKLRAFGALGENGIILVETRSKKELSPESQMILNGISPFRPSRIYSGASIKNPRTPDLRSCLFWCPIVKLNSKNEAEVNFTTSDDLGEMVIQIEGKTINGERIFEERTFIVSFPPKKS